MGLAHLRPLTDSMALVYSFDPGLDRPPPVGDDLKGEAREAAEKALNEFLNAFRVASERLDFSPIMKSGETLTMFHFRPLSDAEIRRVRALPLSNEQLAALTVRLCLERVENGGDLLSKIERKSDPEFPGLGKLATAAYMEVLGALSTALDRPRGDLTNELGAAVFLRSLNLDPK